MPTRSNDLLNKDIISQLKQLNTPNSGFIEGLIELFSQQGQQLINQISIAIQNNDAINLQKAAHTLKGAALNMGGKQLAEASHAFEITGKENSISSNTNQQLERLTNLFDETKAALQTLFNGNQ